MTTMTRQTALQIKREMTAALEQIALKHGFSLEMGAGTYNDSRFGIKVGFNTSAPAAVQSINMGARTADESIPSYVFNAYNLDPNALGPKGERLVAFHANRPKYPFVYQTVRGARWKLDEAGAKVMFGKR